MNAVLKKQIAKKRYRTAFPEIDEKKLSAEIRIFEEKLRQVGTPGNDPYKKALVNAFTGLLETCKSQMQAEATVR